MNKFQRVKKELDRYKLEVEKLKKEIEILTYENNLLKSNNIDKVHNERGAGRKSRFSDMDREMMRMYRIQGKTIKEIAEMYSCSVGLVHKIVSE